MQYPISSWNRRIVCKHTIRTCLTNWELQVNTKVSIDKSRFRSDQYSITVGGGMVTIDGDYDTIIGHVLDSQASMVLKVFTHHTAVSIHR